MSNMMFTRSAARALLTNRVTIENDKLSEDVLLEIFDAYRQLYGPQPDYEKLWNSRDGWFKLAHVCLRWRRVVLLWPSRLHVHLLFTPRRSSRAPVLRCLPRLPILVDYSAASWTEKEGNLALAAIEHRSRVRGIALRRPCSCIARLFKALSHPFPELESLEICCRPYIPYDELILPATFLSGSASSLRRLTLRDVVPECLPPLLSSATGLVELALTLRVRYSMVPEASLIANLQRMSCLRRLELKLSHGGFNTTPDSPAPPACAGDVVPLSKLTDLIFMGFGPWLQMLVVRLAAPSLRHLDADLWGSPMSSIQPLCKFICDTNCQFIAVRLDFSRWKLKFSAETCSKSDHAQPFRIGIAEPVSLEEIGNLLSGPLSTVEELAVGWAVSLSTQQHQNQWRGFFNHIRQVKTIQVPFEVAPGVAHSFQLDGQEPALDLLPTLQQVKVGITYISPIESDRIDRYVSIRDAFEPLVAARQQVGRPIQLSWI
ncbi:hypothetical protein BJY52DRAFT_63336 [Lactarius psammicola]|nr:hypothetical protein BJY52DRAFT_63336 [Lactarius psammicola]